MLYQLYELHDAALMPMRVAAEAGRHLFAHPYLPTSYTRFGRTVAAACEMLERTSIPGTHAKPAFGIAETEAHGRCVPVHERVVMASPFCRLVHFEREVPPGDPVVLLVAPLSGHFPTLLRDTVRALLPGHEVYITDWTDARLVPLMAGRFDLDDYIDLIVDFLRALGPDVHVVGVCQPSVPVLAAVALMAAEDDPAQPRSMVLMGGPIDTRINPTSVNRLAQSRSIEWFERSVIATVPALYPGFARRVYPGFVQLTGFMSMNLERHIGAHIDLFNHLVRGDGEGAEQQRRFYDEYLAVMDLPAEFYLQTVATVFQEHALPRAVMTSRGRPVDTGAIRHTALMTVEGEKDDISGLGQTYAAHALCPNLPAERHEHWEQPEVGHYGVFHGRRWRESIMPRMAEFFRRSA